MNKKELTVEDDIHLRTIKDICELFKAPIKKRGFLYPGIAIHPTKKNTTIWWPSTKNRQGWKNIVNEDYSQIIETHENETKHTNHVDNILKNGKEIRYVFLHHKFGKGRETYKFIGKFKLDSDRTNTKNGVIWIKTSDKIKKN